MTGLVSLNKIFERVQDFFHFVSNFTGKKVLCLCKLFYLKLIFISELNNEGTENGKGKKRF